MGERGCERLGGPSHGAAGERDDRGSCDRQQQVQRQAPGGAVVGWRPRRQQRIVGAALANEHGSHQGAERDRVGHGQGAFRELAGAGALGPFA